MFGIPVEQMSPFHKICDIPIIFLNHIVFVRRLCPRQIEVITCILYTIAILRSEIFNSIMNIKDFERELPGTYFTIVLNGACF